MACLSLVLFWIYGDRPLVAEPWQGADDGLYLTQAEGFVRWLHGQEKEWLGPYDAWLLSKAPLFAIWLGGLHILQLPLRLAEYALVLLLPWLFRAAVRPVVNLSGWQLIITGTVLTALPFLPLEQRLLRSVLQAALTSSSLIAAVGLMLRARRADAAVAGWAALTGLLFALAYLNREETVWLVPMMLCGLGAILIGAWSRRSWRLGLVAAGCLLSATAIPIAIISALNYHSYGVFFTTVRRAPAFIRAHQLMTRLEPETRERYVPIRTATRLKAYTVSPTFARLSPCLEGPATDWFARYPGHLVVSGLPPTAREFVVMNFQFALQQCAFAVGARTANDCEALFAAIVRELESAIALGSISAGSGGLATLASPLPGDYVRIVKQTAVSLWKLYAFDGMALPTPRVSSGTPRDLRRMEDMTHTPIAPTKEMKPLDLPDVGAEARRVAYDAISKLEMAVYMISTATLLAFVLVIIARHRGDLARVDQTVAALVLCGSLLAFSVGIAMADVLGFPILIWSVEYNTQGYSPLSVLSAFGLVLLFSWFLPNGTVPAVTSRPSSKSHQPTATARVADEESVRAVWRS
jgi:hypothetical protein